jgi:hypothetical protein
VVEGSLGARLANPDSGGKEIEMWRKKDERNEALEGVAKRLREERPEVSPLELDRIKARAMARVRPANGRVGARRLAVAGLTVGLLAATTGGVLAERSGEHHSKHDESNAAVTQYAVCDNNNNNGNSTGTGNGNGNGNGKGSSSSNGNNNGNNSNNNNNTNNCNENSFEGGSGNVNVTCDANNNNGNATGNGNGNANSGNQSNNNGNNNGEESNTGNNTNNCNENSFEGGNGSDPGRGVHGTVNINTTCDANNNNNNSTGTGNGNDNGSTGPTGQSNNNGGNNGNNSNNNNNNNNCNNNSFNSYYYYAGATNNSYTIVSADPGKAAQDPPSGGPNGKHKGNKARTSRRHIRIHVLLHHGSKLHMMTVQVNGKHVKTLYGRAASNGVELVDLPCSSGATTVTVSDELSTGQVVSSTRQFHLCVARAH